MAGCEHAFQAEAFVGWFRRLDPPVALWDAFTRWARSKDFAPADEQAIAAEVLLLLGDVGDDSASDTSVMAQADG